MSTALVCPWIYILIVIVIKEDCNSDRDVSCTMHTRQEVFTFKEYQGRAKQRLCSNFFYIYIKNENMEEQKSMYAKSLVSTKSTKTARKPWLVDS